MTTLVRRPMLFNPQGLASFFGDVGALGARTFENMMAPYRVSAEGDTKVVSVDLAGFTKDDIDVSLDEANRTLRIAASVKSDDSDPEREESERVQGFYNRKVSLSFSMPENADYESITSQYTDGVLKVSFGSKTAEESAPRKITVG